MSSKNLPIVDWLQIESSAPGKFIISGEYSVVYDRIAVAAAIDRRTNVTIRPNKEAKVRLNLKNLNCVREWPTSLLTSCKLISKYSECLDFNETLPGKLAYLLHPQPSQQPKDSDKKTDDAVLAFLLLYIGLGDSYCSSARPPLDIEVDSSVPVGSGMGSSSAYSAALCGALMRVFRVAAEKYIISNWAFNVDKFFHGSPSGVDNNIVVFGGYIQFQSGKIKSTGVEHKTPIKVMLIDTCVSRSTKTLTENVKAQLSDNRDRINGLFNSINEITIQIWLRINEVDFTARTIDDYLEANQQYLDSLGVGHEKLTDICRIAMEHGTRAKQTGAGGGGTAFVLYDSLDDNDRINSMRDCLMKAGYRVHDHDVGCKGLTVKIIPDPSKVFPISCGSSER